MAPDGQFDRGFGRSVDISFGGFFAEDVVIVGAPSDGPDADVGAGEIFYGSAYLFRASTGAFLAKFELADGDTFNALGLSVAVGAGVALAGEPGRDFNGSNTGAAYMVVQSSAAPIAPISVPDRRTSGGLGGQVALGNALAAVEGNGGVYVFARYNDGGPIAISPKLLTKLVPEEGDLVEDFGTAMDLFDGALTSFQQGPGMRVAVTALDRWQPFSPGGGRAFVFDVFTSRQIAELLPSDGGGGRDFGESVAVWEDAVFVGAPLDFTDNFGQGPGSVYVYDLSSDPAEPVVCEGDIDGDGVVGPDDLFALLARFGELCE